MKITRVIFSAAIIICCVFAGCKKQGVTGPGAAATPTPTLTAMPNITQTIQAALTAVRLTVEVTQTAIAQVQTAQAILTVNALASYTRTYTRSVTPTRTQTLTFTDSPTRSVTCTITPTYTETKTITPTFTITVTYTITPTVTLTVTPAPVGTWIQAPMPSTVTDAYFVNSRWDSLNQRVYVAYQTGAGPEGRKAGRTSK